MANDELRAAAKKELLRRKARAELARRRGQSTQQPQVSTTEDVLKSGGVGLAQGAIEIPGLIGDTQQLAGNIAGGAARMFGAGDEFQAGLRDKVARLAVPLPGVIGNLAPTSEQLRGSVENVTGDFYKPQTTPGEFAYSAGRFIPSTMMGPGSTAMKLGVGVASGLGSEAAGQATKGTELEPYARVAGAVAGGVPVAAGLDLLQAPRVAGQTKISSALLKNALPNDMSKFRAMGPDAMLLDASPSTVGLAQGATMAPGAAKDALVEALLNRDKGRSGRLLADKDSMLGPARDPIAFKKQIQKEVRVDAKPYYDQATRNPPDLRYDPALENTLAQELTNPAKGMSTAARAKNMEWMTKIEDALTADTPQGAVSRLHSLRKELDSHIEFNPMASSAEKADRAVAENVRKVIDKVLKERVPGFKEGDKIYSEGQRAIEGVDYGYDSLDGGKSAAFPQTFNEELKRLPTEFVAEGQNSRIANAMGTQANDLSALRKMLGGDGDFNRAKLNSTFGANKVDGLLKSVDREGTFAQNFADVSRNSQTAQRQAAQRQIETSVPFQISDSASFTGIIGKTGAKLLNALLSKGAGAISAKTSEALAKALKAKGANAEKLFSDLKKTGPQKTAAAVALISALNGAKPLPQGNGR
jgi:hypothetical protein